MMNRVEVRIYDGPLPASPAPCRNVGAGAALVFEGVVRPLEEGRTISALDYELYEPMAARILQDLAGELSSCHGLIGMTVEHSRGRVAVGQCSFRLQVTAPHRQPALIAMGQFIDRMKQDAPIWKTPVWDATG
jgi:molybdopterin synthase catalytic subunit